MKTKDMKGTESVKTILQRQRFLPPVLYTRYQGGGSVPWLRTAETFGELAEKDVMVYVGEYQLLKVHRVRLEMKVF